MPRALNLRLWSQETETVRWRQLGEAESDPHVARRTRARATRNPRLRAPFPELSEHRRRRREPGGEGAGQGRGQAGGDGGLRAGGPGSGPSAG